ncbi:MAG: hypothetical protein JO103_12375 [Candidatus Eremiobacteraeota bacterium]|nr:hypothetical protein [Candidatus Eremiobacteraeota bacterium]
MLSSPMKCGSTYVARILARYLGTDVPELTYDWLAEHMFTRELRDQLCERPFVLTLHMRPHTSNLQAFVEDGVIGVVQWRNLADTIVSFDDHCLRYGAHNPIFYVDHVSFMRMPPAARHRYVIDRAIPWSLGFYLSWRRLPGVCLHPYEEMVRDPFGFFRFMLWQAGIAVDDARLREALVDIPEGSRFNVGVIGRGAHVLDEEIQHHIERHVVDHPEFDELEVLLWELPWEPRTLERHSPFDGTTVRREGDETCWFVSRGIRHAVDSRWMVSRATQALRHPAVVDRAALNALRIGPALS